MGSLPILGEDHQEGGEIALKYSEAWPCGSRVQEPEACRGPLCSRGSPAGRRGQRGRVLRERENAVEESSHPSASAGFS